MVGGFPIHGPEQSFIKPLDELRSILGDVVSEPFVFNNQPEPFNGVKIGGIRWQEYWFKITPIEFFLFVPGGVIADKQIPPSF